MQEVGRAGPPGLVGLQHTGWAVCVSMMYQLFQDSQLSHFVSHDVVGFWASAILMQIMPRAGATMDAHPLHKPILFAEGHSFPHTARTCTASHVTTNVGQSSSASGCGSADWQTTDAACTLECNAGYFPSTNPITCTDADTYTAVTCDGACPPNSN